jgi:hypothetical protein
LGLDSMTNKAAQASGGCSRFENNCGGGYAAVGRSICRPAMLQRDRMVAV